jgi:hypothetical protein
MIVFRFSMGQELRGLRVARKNFLPNQPSQTKRILIKRKISIGVKKILWYTSVLYQTQSLSASKCLRPCYS